jgi:radical SAM enzyme (TIGR01210 family)
VPETTPYPTAGRERNRWITAQRSSVDTTSRAVLDPWRPAAFLTEEERAHNGEIVPVSTLFLTNKECPWRCLMCDLWRHTLTERVPIGAIPAQIDYALSQLPEARQIKLYNSGSFFDRGAIPPEDYPKIAARLQCFERVIVENHPALLGDDCLRFRDMVPGQLEVAMGLETVHPEVAPRLNKGASLEQFSQAAQWLQSNSIDLRVFILVKPPFMDEAESLYWAQRSLDFAFDCGATLAALIPTRFGNGALETLAGQGQFSPPKLKTLENAANYGVQSKRGRVFADLWDLEQFSDCPSCFAARRERLSSMNRRQVLLPSIRCKYCGENL